ncbi:MAG: holin family protein [Candidatus Symbiobacter sp.]|nr:holin family protein [Candidatus Symbiobacter sp.]
MIPIIDSVLGIGKDLIERLIPDPVAQMSAKLKLAELQAKGELESISAHLQLNIEQIKLNAAEEANNNSFRAGWRPFMGWVCAVGFLYEFLLCPIINGGLIYFVKAAPMPSIDTSALMTLLTGMLGIGGLRTIEKLQGIK